MHCSWELGNWDPVREGLPGEEPQSRAGNKNLIGAELRPKKTGSEPGISLKQQGRHVPGIMEPAPQSASHLRGDTSRVWSPPLHQPRTLRETRTGGRSKPRITSPASSNTSRGAASRRRVVVQGEAANEVHALLLCGARGTDGAEDSREKQLVMCH
ncbi:unnamed protein product [Boreogadus saida]